MPRTTARRNSNGSRASPVACPSRINPRLLLRGVMTRSLGTVVFSHGRESGPWGSKITAMAAVVRDLGLAVVSIDYRGLDDPEARGRQLNGEGAGVDDPPARGG